MGKEINFTDGYIDVEHNVEISSGVVINIHFLWNISLTKVDYESELFEKLFREHNKYELKMVTEYGETFEGSACIESYRKTEGVNYLDELNFAGIGELVRIKSI